MTEETNTPAILVVDDEEVWREERIPDILALLQAEIVKVGSPEDGLRVVAERMRQGQRPFDLVVLDMHMRLPGGQKQAPDAGERWLRVIRSFRLERSPVVVFTAHANFTDCLNVAKAGADAYVSKFREPHPIPGEPVPEPRELLLRVCQDLLAKRARAEQRAPPTPEWLHEHYAWLQQNYAGKWVAFLPEEMITRAGLTSDKDVRTQGLAVVAGKTYEAVRDVLVASPVIFERQPAIVMVPEAQGSSSGETGGASDE